MKDKENLGKFWFKNVFNEKTLFSNINSTNNRTDENFLFLSGYFAWNVDSNNKKPDT